MRTVFLVVFFGYQTVRRCYNEITAVRGYMSTMFARRSDVEKRFETTEQTNPPFVSIYSTV